MSDFKYEVDDGKATITDYTGAGGDVIVPSTIDGLPVTAIGDNAFCHCTGLTIITLPEGCTTIGYAAFVGCTGLTSITLPNSLTTIWEWAFANCSGLTSITLPNSLTTIGGRAFYYCTSLTSIFLPEGCSIGEGAFEDCPATITIRDKEDEQ